MSKGGQRIIGVDEIMLKTRFNPLLRAINMIKKVKSVERRLKFTLQLAPFFYAPAKSDAQTPLSPTQSVQRAEQAHKLLTALENNIKKQKKSLNENSTKVDNIEKQEKVASRPPSDAGNGLPERPGGSDNPSLGNGQAEV